MCYIRIYVYLCSFPIAIYRYPRWTLLFSVVFEPSDSGYYSLVTVAKILISINVSIS
jgi:hypothetical protein